MQFNNKGFPGIWVILRVEYSHYELIGTDWAHIGHKVNFGTKSDNRAEVKKVKWRAWRESNPRPMPSEGITLSSWATSAKSYSILKLRYGLCALRLNECCLRRPTLYPSELRAHKWRWRSLTVFITTQKQFCFVIYWFSSRLSEWKSCWISGCVINDML